ncbi:hypothetical protein [Candidatus Contubernalis alkaliaceticus]|uniref:hypothetical protein n=1 Tax=Candidatus Contubernalis alkaliaceticus TaxID=338645 RepID=UPI001F4BF254|nr:hypothetical protein [Candidatus Contubernalis alkalaceticus]UNC92636.1 hypothetical protein HUE98_11330 [Candidatus Contubernalis alkalaceticus]
MKKRIIHISLTLIVVVVFALLYFHYVLPRENIISASLTQQTVEQITDESDIIITGTVKSEDTSWFHNTSKRIQVEGWESDKVRYDLKYIVTYYTVEIEEYLKGDGPKEITVGLLGGTVRNHTYIFEDSPTLTEGEKVLLFLQPS